MSKRINYQALYLRRAHRVASLLAGLPFVRGIALAGSLAQGKARQSSDIDYLILLEPNRLFTARFLVTLLVQILGLRRTGRLIAGRICLNHYQTLRELPVAPHSQEHAEDLAQLVPLVDDQGAFGLFWQANPELSRRRQRAGLMGMTADRSRSRRVTQAIQRLGERLFGGFLGNKLEDWLGHLQRVKIRTNPVTPRFPTRIRVTDDQLLFHPREPLATLTEGLE